jgi:hypothetical protein
MYGLKSVSSNKSMYGLKSVSSNKSMSYKITVRPNPCPFIVQICVLWNRFSLKSVSSQIDFPSDLCPSLSQKNDVIIIGETVSVRM